MNKIDQITDKKIKSPEGVALLMASLWYGRKAGKVSNANNVYMVDLPPLTEEEKSQIDKVDKVKANFKDTRDAQVSDTLTLSKRIRAALKRKTIKLRNSFKRNKVALPIRLNCILTDQPFLDAIDNFSVITSKENNYISVYFGDILSVLKRSKCIGITSVEVEGGNRIRELMEKLFHSYIWSKFDIKKYRNIMLKFICSRHAEEKLFLKELEDIQFFAETFPESINVNWVIAEDSTLGDRMKLIFLAC